MRGIGVVCVLLGAWHAAAAAQSDAAGSQVVLLTPTRSESPTAWEGVVRGLHDAGITAIQVADARVDPIFAACSLPECAVQVAAAARLPALLCSVQLQGQGAAATGTLELQWVEGDGKHWSARASVRSGALVAVATGLAENLRRQRALGDRALLRVESTPAGAIVAVDGQLAGLTPFEREYTPGPHVLEVSYEGRESDRRAVELRPGVLHGERVRLPLLPLAAKPAPEPTRGPKPLAANVVVGAALAVAAAPLFVLPINAAIDDGQCLESLPSGRCIDQARFGSTEAVLLTAGLVAAGIGLYLLIGQPWRAPVERETTSSAAPVAVRAAPRAF
ncbi:MAG: PEGA domain-containing protein [Polyangiales bacterium]